MNLIIAIVPVLSLIVLMAFFKMSGDKSSIISLVVTMLIAFFGFHFPLDDLLFSFLYGAMKAVSPILIIILMAIFSYNVLLKTEKMEIIKQQFSSISTDKSIQVLLLTWGFGGLLEAMAGFGTAVAIPAAILISLGFKPIFPELPAADRMQFFQDQTSLFSSCGEELCIVVILPRNPVFP